MPFIPPKQFFVWSFMYFLRIYDKSNDFPPTSHRIVTLECLLQDNMKKRLQYAMPRVPLRKLKQIPGNCEEDTDHMKEEPVSYVERITRRIVQARKGKQGNKQRTRTPLGGDVGCTGDDGDGSSADEDQGRNLLEAAGPIPDEENQHEVVHPSQLSTKDTFDLEEEEEQLVKSLQQKLRRRKKRVELRVFDIANEEEEYIPVTKTSDVKDCPQGQKMEGEKTLVVQALVHDVEQEKPNHVGAMADRISFDGVEPAEVNKNNWITQGDAAKCNTQDEGHSGARLKTKGMFLEKGNNDQTTERKTKGRGGRKRNWKTECKTETGRQVEWGLDESSESDGDWEGDQGDIPLLPLD